MESLNSGSENRDRTCVSRGGYEPGSTDAIFGTKKGTHDGFL